MWRELPLLNVRPPYLACPFWVAMLDAVWTEPLIVAVPVPVFVPLEVHAVAKLAASDRRRSVAPPATVVLPL